MTNYSTQLTPLAQKRFKFQIKDDLFEQYFMQIQKKKDKSIFINKNSKSIYFTITATVRFENHNSPEIVVYPFFMKYKSITTNSNKSPYAKLLINILNCLSLWLSLSIFSIYFYISKTFIIFKKIYLLLLKLKNTFEFILIDRITSNRQAASILKA